MDTDTLPNGGWQFVQPQTGWSAPAPTGNTFSQQVNNIIKHRRTNIPIVARHKLSIDSVAVGNELMSYNELRLGISPKTLPPPPQKELVSGAVGAAVVAVRKLAAGNALLLEWQESGESPVPGGLSAKRAAVCAVCPKNDNAGLTRYFTVPVSERIRKQFEVLHKLNLTTPDDEKLHVCAACLCPLKLKAHAPLHLILKRLKPEQKADLNQDNPKCWILTEST